jgi:hypothetical protein
MVIHLQQRCPVFDLSPLPAGFPMIVGPHKKGSRPCPEGQRPAANVFFVYPIFI